MVDLLTIRYDEDTIELLRNEGYSYEFSRETYIEDLKNVIEECTASVANYEQAIKDKETLTGAQGKGTIADYSYWATLTNIISKNNGIPITIDLNCEQWAAYYKDLFTPKKKPVNERAAD